MAAARSTYGRGRLTLRVKVAAGTATLAELVCRPAAVFSRPAAVFSRPTAWPLPVGPREP